MPNEYSIKIHDYLTARIAEAERAVARGDRDAPFYRGQLVELHRLRDYLRENVDLKDFNYY